MRVLIVTNMYPSPANPALGSFVRDQVECLRRSVELELFAFDPGGPGAYLRAARELRARHGGERFDVVHAHYGLSGWVALAIGGPHVVTFHGTDLAHPVVGPLSRVLSRRIALPAPVSASLAREGLPAGRRLAVLPVGVNLERFHPVERAAARAALGLKPDGHYLLFAADPARPAKRHDRASALAQATGAELLSYAGSTPDRIPLLMNAADAVVCTSEREGFGLAPLEALACDAPVLATPVGIAPTALAGVSGTLCAPFELDSWAAAASRLLERGGARVEGRARASLYRRERFAERVLAAYRAVVRGPVAPL